MPPSSCLPATAQQQRAWELSSYDLQRKCHRQLHPDQLIECCPESVLSDVTCPICLDILKDTMTTKECLHRFCSQCITTALRNGNKECPSCRKKLISKRSLRPDHNFDNIINCLFPNRADLEDFQNRIANSLKPACTTTTTSNSNVDRDGRLQSNVSEASISRKRVHSASFPSRTCDFNVLLAPHPDATGTVRHLRTQPNATVQHLLSFMRMRCADRAEKAKCSGMSDCALSDWSDLPNQQVVLWMRKGDLQSGLVRLDDCSENLAAIADRFGMRKAANLVGAELSNQTADGYRKENFDALLVYYQYEQCP